VHAFLCVHPQGRLRVTTRRDGAPAASELTPFYMLGLDLPPPPLFQDVMEKNIIPQVALATCLAKFDGATEQDVLRAGRKTYTLDALPPYLILHMKRFTKNNFFVEKNPTIVTFPVRNLELRDALPLPPGLASKYDLVANICHDGACRGARGARACWGRVADGTRDGPRRLAARCVCARQAGRGRLPRAGAPRGRHVVRGCGCVLAGACESAAVLRCATRAECRCSCALSRCAGMRRRT
jgi:hypothetical protein